MSKTILSTEAKKHTLESLRNETKEFFEWVFENILSGDFNFILKVLSIRQKKDIKNFRKTFLLLLIVEAIGFIFVGWIAFLF